MALMMALMMALIALPGCGDSGPACVDVVDIPGTTGVPRAPFDRAEIDTYPPPSEACGRIPVEDYCPPSDTWHAWQERGGPGRIVEHPGGSHPGWYIREVWCSASGSLADWYGYIVTITPDGRVDQAALKTPSISWSSVCRPGTAVFCFSASTSDAGMPLPIDCPDPHPTCSRYTSDASIR